MEQNLPAVHTNIYSVTCTKLKFVCFSFWLRVLD